MVLMYFLGFLWCPNYIILIIYDDLIPYDSITFWLIGMESVLISLPVIFSFNILIDLNKLLTFKATSLTIVYDVFSYLSYILWHIMILNMNFSNLGPTLLQCK